ncbi:MAG: hypothetical protein IPG93_22330 [Burkholderiales bacterium]|nr:hypothetical protein [Burkholderiales bacterium]
MIEQGSNFGFLAEHSPLLCDLGATAERVFPFDPANCVLKLRLLAEALTKEIAARMGVTLLQPTQAELLRAVDSRLNSSPRPFESCCSAPWPQQQLRWPASRAQVTTCSPRLPQSG